MLLVRHQTGRFADPQSATYTVAHYYLKPWLQLTSVRTANAEGGGVGHPAPLAEMPLAQLCALNRYLRILPLGGSNDTGGGAPRSRCAAAMSSELTKVRAALAQARLPQWPLCLTECDVQHAHGTWDTQFWGYSLF